MQRRYVWRATRVRDLLDSLYRGYPSGAILLWQTDEPVPGRDMAVSQEGNPFQTTRLLLDGQQRLTSLSAVIRGEPVTVRGRRKPIDLLFNLDHPDELSVVTEVDEESDEDVVEDEADSTEDELQRRFERMTFVVATKKLQKSPRWVRVTDVFRSNADAEFLKRAGVTSLDDPLYQKYSQRLARLRAIRRYVYRMDILERTLSYEEVTEIFVRVNSLGAKLRSSDLALAQITAKWRNSLETFQLFQLECQEMGFDLDLGLHLKNLIVYATGQSRFKTVGGVSVDRLKDGWERGKEAMEFALNFLKSNARIDSPVLLSSPFLIIALGYYGAARKFEIGRDEADRLRHWVLAANAKGRYSRGSSETILDQDLTIIKQGGQADDLVDRLRAQVGRLSIAPEELEGRNQRSALFKTMFLAFRAGGATDWGSNLTISLGHKGNHHRLQFHHIFPKAYLKGHFTSRETDDIANLCFIAGKTNRRISSKGPAHYFPTIMADGEAAALAAQCIPTAPDLLERSSYPAFLAKRRVLIADRLNEFLAHGVSDDA